MDFLLSPQQDLLRQTLRELFQREYPPRAVRATEAAELGYDATMYRRLGELGVLGLPLSEDEGGAEGGWVELAVLYEEAGRALLLGPHLASVVLGARLLARWGSDAERAAWVRPLASGERTLALGWPLDRGEPGPSGLDARADGRGYVLDGEVTHVAGWPGADAVLLAAEIAGTGGRLAIFLAEPNAAGIGAVPQPLISGERLVRLRCDDVRVTADAAVGEPQSAQELLGFALDGAKVAVAARGLGLAAAALDMAVAYAKEREQFGRPIGSFQAIQHRLANLAMRVEQVRWLVYAAAWQLDQRLDAHRAAAMAKLRAGEVARDAGKDCILVHGGYGFIVESDPQLYYRQGKTIEFLLGTPEAQRALVTAEHAPFVSA